MPTRKVTPVKTVKFIKPVVEKEKYLINYCKGSSIASAYDIFKDEFSTIEGNDIELATPSMNISFDTNESPHTCGFVEFGNLISAQISDAKKAAADFDKFMQCVFADCNKTYYINTNGKNDSVQFEKFLPLCKTFSLVKTYVNPSSKNTLKLWVSTN